MIAGSLCGESCGTVVGYLIGYGHTNTWTQTRVKNGTHNRQLSVKPAIDMNLVTPKCIARVHHGATNTRSGLFLSRFGRTVDYVSCTKTVSYTSSGERASIARIT